MAEKEIEKRELMIDRIEGMIGITSDSLYDMSYENLKTLYTFVMTKGYTQELVIDDVNLAT